MDKLEYYRSTIKKILTRYYEMTVKGAIALNKIEICPKVA